MIVSGAIYGFAQSADRAARFADPHIAQLICRSRSAICGYTHCTTNRQIAQLSQNCASIGRLVDVISLISLNLGHIEVVSFNIHVA